MEIALKVPFPRSNERPKKDSGRPSASGATPKAAQKLESFPISMAFRLDFNAAIHMLSGWKPTDSLFSLRADSTGFQAPPPFKRPPQQNAGRLETDDASQPIGAFVFLPESILIGFYILWKENVLE